MKIPKEAWFAGIGALIVALGVGVALARMDAPVGRAADLDKPLPSFPADAQWLNSRPLTVDALRGHVVLVDVWTFDCWNCYRSFPWLIGIEQRWPATDPRGLRIIGVHTPEYAHEKVAANVAEKAQSFALHHPILLDPDLAYWNALDNRYWPTFYLVDRAGRIRARYIGEMHAGAKPAAAIEAKIAELLAEP